MSIQIDQALDWRGRAVVDRDGHKIGTFDEIYLEEGTNEPAWAAVKPGRFALRRRVVPIATAEADGEHVRVPFTKDQVKSAPTIDSDGWVPERDQTVILRHYGLSGATADSQPETTAQGAPATESAEPPGSTEAMDTPEAHRMKLRRYTVTETLTRRSDFGPE
jgi:sporulation protein YlmC with PRC-barrel domain